MTVTVATILLYLVALFLTVATVWLLSLFLYATQTNSPEQTDHRFFLVLIGAVLPFFMLIYFGFTFIISDTISLGAPWPTTKKEELSFSESLVAAVTYVGLSGWLWLRWRNPTAPRTGILGAAIIATVIIVIIVGVIWNAHHDHMF
jgi:hypothetical protein